MSSKKSNILYSYGVFYLAVIEVGASEILTRWHTGGLTTLCAMVGKCLDMVKDNANLFIR